MKEGKKSGIFLTIFALVVSIIGIYLGNYAKSIDNRIGYLFSYYVSIVFICIIIGQYTKDEYILLILYIIVLPLGLIFKIASITQPIFGWIQTLAVSLGIATIPVFVFDKIYTPLNFATKSYLIITLFSILLSYFGDRIYSWVLGTGKNAKYIEIGLQTFNQKFFRLILVFSYCIAIVATTIANASGKQLFDIDKLDYIIIQSFATFVAWDRVSSTWKTIDIKFKNFIKNLGNFLNLEMLGEKPEEEEKEEKPTNNID